MLIKDQSKVVLTDKNAYARITLGTWTEDAPMISLANTMCENKIAISLPENRPQIIMLAPNGERQTIGWVKKSRIEEKEE